MFLTVFTKHSVGLGDLSARSGEIFGRFVSSIVDPAQVHSVLVNDSVVLHYAGSSRVNCCVQRGDGSWLYSLGVPSEPGTAAPDSREATALRWLSRYLEVPDAAGFLQGLDGSFVIVIYDSNNRSLHVLPDLACVGLAFIVETAQFVGVSNSSTLLAMLAGSRLDDVGALVLLHNHYLPGPRSLFEGVTQVRNFMAATVTDQGLQTAQVFDPFTAAVPRFKGLKELAGSLLEIYAASMRGRSTSYSESSLPLLALTGGKDSRLVAALGKYVGLPLECFVHPTFGTEAEVSQRVAKALGLNHRTIQNQRRTAEGFLHEVTRRSLSYDCELPGPFGQYDFFLQFQATEPATIMCGHGSAGFIRDYQRLGRRETWHASSGEIAGLLALQQLTSVTPATYLEPGLREVGLGYTTECFQADVRHLRGLQPVTLCNYLYCRHRMPRHVGRLVNACQELAPTDNPLANFRVMSMTMQAPPNVFDFDNLVRLLTALAAPQLTDIPYSDGTSARPAVGVWRSSWRKGCRLAGRAAAFGLRSLGVDVHGRKREAYMRCLKAQDLSPAVTWRQIYDLPLGQQLLSPHTLRSAGLYDMDAYGRTLREVLDEPFSAHHPLAVSLQIEIAAQRLEGSL